MFSFSELKRFQPSTLHLQPLSLWLRSLLFAGGLLLSGTVAATLIVALLLIPNCRRYQYPLSQRWCRFSMWWLRLTCEIDYQVTGSEHLPAAAEPTIIMAKHQSTWETLFLHQYLPPLAWVAKRELLWIPFFGWAFATLNPIVINRSAKGSSMKQILRSGRERLQQGQWVLIFPEGTRLTPGERRKYGNGGAILAMHSNCRIVPVALNSGEFWPRGGFIKRPGTVQVVFGAPLFPEDRSVAELTREVETWIEEKMLHLAKSAPHAE